MRTNSIKRNLFEKKIPNDINHKKNILMRKIKNNEIKNNETEINEENDKIVYKEKHRYRERNKNDNRNELHLIIHGRAVDEGGGEVRNRNGMRTRE